MFKMLILMLVSTMSNPSLLASQADAILGVWLTEIEDAKIEIYKSSNKYYGRVVWIKEALDENGKPVVDKNNPDPKMQSNPILESNILIGFIYDNDGEWDGKIYDPKKGETYTCKLWLEAGKLKVRGYLGWLFDTKTWSRVK